MSATAPPDNGVCQKIANALNLNDAEKNKLFELAVEERFTKDAPAIEHMLKHGRPQSEQPHVKTREIPLVSWVSANRFASAEDPFPPGLADEYRPTTIKGGNMFALRVSMDCMEPEFVEGDIIFVRPDIQAENGDFVIVRDNKKNEATFKQLKKYGKTTVLHPLNPKYQDIVLDHDERYQIVGVVVSKEKRYRK